MPIRHERQGKYFEIQFNQDADPVGGIITNFLLEKGRVVDPSKGERNFHIFYQFCKGASQQQKQEYGLHGPDAFEYLVKGKCTDVSTIDDVKWWKETLEAMQVIGIAGNDQANLFKCLAAILWLGNIEFQETAGKAAVKNSDVLDFVATLLGVPASFVGNGLVIRQMETKHGARAGTNYAVPLNRMQV